MDQQEPFSAYFDSALKIHAVCADLEYSDEDARVYTYIHAKASETGRGVEYFSDPAPEDSEALEIMLGIKRSIEIPSMMTLDEKENEAVELILSISDKISQLDHLLAKECGLENRFSGELKSRLRLYKDKEYRDRMVGVYVNEIVPRLNQYDKSRIDDAFRRHQEEKDRQEKELLKISGLWES
ncbi:MAG: hypothetical protein ACLFQB_07995 [Chitinispirillaceae bacterium]